MSAQWLVLVGGEYHDYEAGGAALASVLTRALGARAVVTDDVRAMNKERLRACGGVLLYGQGNRLNAAQTRALDHAVRNDGKALVAVHSGCVFERNPTLFELLGVRFTGHPPMGEFPVRITDREVWLTQRLFDFRITDELYRVETAREGSRVLAAFAYQGRTYPAAFCREAGRGKVFYLALGHDQRAWGHATFRKLLGRGARWAAGGAAPRPLGAAVVGYGGAFNMGKHHIEGMNRWPGYKPLAICDIAPDRQAQARLDYPKLDVVGSVGDLLKLSGIDLIVVITPHNAHTAPALAALRAGKHVVIEKPMATSADDCNAMIEAARERKVVVVPYHNRRYDGDFLTLRGLLQAGAIGNVFQLEACHGGYGEPGAWWRSDKTISGGIAFDWGAHYVDWITHLVPGRIAHVIGHFHKRVWHHVTNEDHAQIIVRFESGAVAEFQDSTIAAAPKARFRILGEKGALLLEHGSEFAKVYAAVGGAMGREMQVRLRKGEWERYYAQLADHLLLCEDPEITAEEGRRNIAIIEAAQESSAKGGVPVKVAYE